MAETKNEKSSSEADGALPERASEEASRERVNDPRWLQKQVVLGGEPCKEKSERTSEEQFSKDYILGELRVLISFFLFP